MQKTNVQSTLIADAIAIIASCTESRPLMETAIALRAITTGKIWVPSGNMEAARRMLRHIVSPAWGHAARTTLANPVVQYLARHFCIACIKGVPIIADERYRGAAWAARAKTFYAREPSMRLLANALLGQVRLLEPTDVPIPAPTPKPPITVSHQNDERAKRFAKAKELVGHFMRHWEAQKARTTMQKIAIQDNSEPAMIPAAPIQSAAVCAPANTAPTPEPIRVQTCIDEQRARSQKPMRFANRRVKRPFTFIPTSLIYASISNSPHPFVELQPYPQGLSPPICI